MILVGSENVYCCEVERVLHDHPQVKAACVYGLPCESMGEAWWPRLSVLPLQKSCVATVLNSWRTTKCLHI